jgi:hypothetical protein
MNYETKPARMLTWMAWTVTIIGAILLAFTVSDFSQGNLPLMIAIGCLIAGMNIFLFSAVFHMMKIRAR